MLADSVMTCCDEYFLAKQRFELNRDTEQAAWMASYMRNLFHFYGVRAALRRGLTKDLLARLEHGILDWDFILACYDDNYRELQYLAIDYLILKAVELRSTDLNKVNFLIKSRSWWDTVDALAGVVGVLIEQNKNLSSKMLDWSRDENLWIRRVSILYQLRYRDDTDLGLLEEVIVNNMGGDEFFINKAIGWSLREYAKTDAEWVRDFLIRHRTELSNLSLREASRYL